MAERSLEGAWVTDDPYGSPNEDFADSFAVCLGGEPRWWTVSGEAPDAEVCDVLSRLVEQ